MKLTIKEALEQGYKFCNIEESEGRLTKISDLASGAVFWDEKETTYYLCDKEPTSHSISKDEIENLIQENIDCQEDYWLEDGFDTALDGCDDLIKQLSERINENIGKHKFYFNTDIQLIP